MNLRTPTAAAVAAVIALTGLATPASGADAVEYGRNDAGGFRNVLPPGSAGVATRTDLASFLASGTLPAHWADQQPLYENLLYAAPGLRDAAVRRYLKDATFGVAPADRSSVVRPRAGVRIVRDRRWGVPRVYGATRRGTMFGAGYAGAADRLFLMDVLRHTGRADLSTFLGGANLASDADQWRFAPYTEADLRRQIRLMRQGHGARGRQAIREVRAYVAGVNGYIAAARADADLMPVEYALIGQPLRRWRITDVIATASLIGGIFGRGGGEVLSAQVLRSLEDRFGRTLGRRIWSGFRSKEDPEAPTTISTRFPYQTGDPFSRRGLALPDAGSVTAAPTGAPGVSAAPAGRRAQMSNWELVAARHSRTGHPLAVMGPQVGYYLPQVLVELELHGPGIDARGASFAGVNMFVQMGHGRDYAWSATSAGSDNVDTFAEVLCGGDRQHYRYRGRCRAMTKLTRTNIWQPNVVDDTPAGSTTLTAWRTAHGIVSHYGRVRGRPVAFVTARSTYFHEADSILGFSRLNDPRFVRDARSFQRAAADINFTFNWAYADARRTAYFLSGAYPIRAAGTSPDFPVLGTGRYDWRGFDPRTFTFTALPPARHPQALDPGVLVSWNNKPAPGWAAADDQWGYGPVYRSQLIESAIDSGLRRGRLGVAALVRSMALPATQDIRGVALLPLLLRAVGTPADPDLAQAVATLRRWQAGGSHRRDLDRDGRYEHDAAVRLMDAWWPLLVRAQFQPRLGRAAFESVQAMIALGAVTGDTPQAPGFSDGWWGYVSKDLRTLYTPAGVSGRYPRVFCGNGDPASCRRVLRAALREALAVTPQELYGVGACAGDPQAACYDRNRPRVTAAINQPGAFPFQNRPTFQQVVSVRRRLAR